MMTLDPKHEAFTKWAKEQGVVINGVAAAKLPGKGFGIVATRKLKVSSSVNTNDAIKSNGHHICKPIR
jgi:hypothetical protein